MPKVVGIIAEYNPFHNGHAALLKMAQNNGYDYSIAVMSGNFVQRAVPAITEKRIRAAAALASGIDLVIELPLPYATASAPNFAMGSVAALRATGVVDAICFGSESGDVSVLRKIANILQTAKYNEYLLKYLSTGITFASARTKAIGAILGTEFEDIARSPNNLLAIEYINAISKLNWDVEIITFKRLAVDHDSNVTSDSFASASFLREHEQNLSEIKDYVPNSSFKIYEKAVEDNLYPANFKNLEVGVLSYLRRLTLKDILVLPDISEGIENRFIASIANATSLNELYDNIKTKRYTMSRARRLVLCAFLDIKASYQTATPPYIRFLGMGSESGYILKKIKQNAIVPFGHSLKYLAETGPMANIFAALEASSTDQYVLSLPSTRKKGYDYYTSSVFIK